MRQFVLGYEAVLSASLSGYTSVPHADAILIGSHTACCFLPTAGWNTHARSRCMRSGSRPRRRPCMAGCVIRCGPATWASRSTCRVASTPTRRFRRSTCSELRDEAILRPFSFARLRERGSPGQWRCSEKPRRRPVRERTGAQGRKGRKGHKGQSGRRRWARAARAYSPPPFTSPTPEGRA